MKHLSIVGVILGLVGCAAPSEKPAGQQSMSRPGAAAKECPACQPDSSAMAAPVTKKCTPVPASRVAAACKLSLSKAIDIALSKVPGQALNATVEFEKGKAKVEVTVFSSGKVYEIDIDATTGAVLEVEQEDDDDDNGDDDDGDGDDD